MEMGRRKADEFFTGPEWTCPEEGVEKAAEVGAGGQRSCRGADGAAPQRRLSELWAVQHGAGGPDGDLRGV